MTTITTSVHFAIKGRRKHAINCPIPTHEEPSTGRLPRISKLMALAIRYDQLLGDRVVQSQSELAELAQVTQPRMTQIMNLLHLAPEIQEQILFLDPVSHGRDPLTERDLRPLTQELDWSEQGAGWKLFNWATDH